MRKSELFQYSKIEHALYALITLQILDVATTMVGLSLGGEEANPLAAVFLQYGVFGLVFLKACSLAIVFWCINYYAKNTKNPKKDGKLLTGILGISVVMYLAVVLNNSIGIALNFP